jgi:hypothetical protein
MTFPPDFFHCRRLLRQRLEQRQRFLILKGEELLTGCFVLHHGHTSLVALEFIVESIEAGFAEVEFLG